MKYKKNILVLVILLTFNAGVATGKTVKIRRGSTVTYRQTVLIDGEVVGATQGGESLQYIHGENMLLPKLEKKLKGMKAGDRKTVTLKAKDAYGPFDPDAIIKFSRDQLLGIIDVQDGMVIRVKTDDGLELSGVVVGSNETLVFIDFNYPLAGMDLTFDISIVEIK